MDELSKQEVINEHELSQQCFQYQLDLLKTEIEIIDKGIARLDDMTKTHKNWSIGIWTGSIAVAIGQPDLRQYIMLTAFIPLLFWIVCALWAFFQTRFIYRETQIAKFINDGRLLESFKKQQFINFTLLDPIGSQYRNTEEYKKQVNIWTAFKYQNLSILYLGMIGVSLVMGIFFLI